MLYLKYRHTCGEPHHPQTIARPDSAMMYRRCAGLLSQVGLTHDYTEIRLLACLCGLDERALYPLSKVFSPPGPRRPLDLPTAEAILQQHVNPYGTPDYSLSSLSPIPKPFPTVMPVLLTGS
jgi:hypothetical protein